MENKGGTNVSRYDGRENNQLRPIRITKNFTKYAEGSVLIEFGDTKVICNATVEENVPPFLRESGSGWVTAEYAMLPRATASRNKRDINKLKLNPRATEIQRLIGRALRAAVDLEALGERSITVDCDVIQADGGTRTASITGGFVALAMACQRLVEEGVLAKAECEAVDWGKVKGSIDYKKIYEGRYPLLRKAYERSNVHENAAYQQFVKENSWWLSDYALFMAVKDRFDGVEWKLWADDIKLRWGPAMDYYREELYFDIEFHQYMQFKFYEQWMQLKTYANKKGIQIIGDIPIYVAMDSADTWAHPELFQLDEENVPVAVAGCPPDGFSATGQLWGNPLYRWGYHKETGYQWWISRLAYVFRLYDVVRIDHFRGFDEYFSIPYGAETAVDGHWEKGPGMDLFNTVKEKLGDVDVIAEDLGYLTESVIEMVKESGYPGMKVLQFAFDSREESDYLPHNYERNCVVYTGTHDNDTILGWYYVMSEEDREFSKEYMGNAKSTDEELPWDFIRMSMESVANLAVTPMQEFLGLGTEARINYPSTLGNNWKWRLLPGQFTPEMAKRIHRLTQITARIAK